MKLLLFVSLVVLGLRPAFALDSGTVEGALEVNGKAIALTHAYAHLHDNAEKLLSRPRELRILLTDREVPPAALAGIVFFPVEDLAREGRVQGILLKMDPRNPNDITVTLLYPPAQPGQGLMTQSVSVTGKSLFSDWKLTDRRVSGGIERKDEAESAFSDIPKLSYSVRFSAPVMREPAVTSDLRGKAAQASPLMTVLAAKARALKTGDFAAVGKLSTERANRRNQAVFALPAPEVKAMARQAGGDMAKLIPNVTRVVVRGDHAVAIFPDKTWATFSREGGQWKSDD